MSEAQKPEISIHIPVEGAEKTKETGTTGLTNSVTTPREVPTITTLLQRKKLTAGGGTAEKSAVSEITKETTQSVIAEPETAAPTVTPARRRGAQISPEQPVALAPQAVAQEGPPPFQRPLILESLDLKAFQKALKKHKKVGDMKKLDCLGYFATRFSEVAYFQVQQPGTLAGVLGFGNGSLVGGIQGQSLTQELLPSVFGLLAQGEIFVGAVESLRAEDREGLSKLGFQALQHFGAFPMMQKKNVIGLWICTGAVAVEMNAKELKALKKTLADIRF